MPTYWVVYLTPKLELPAGTYTILDSDLSTWSYGSESNNCGIVSVIAFKRGATLSALIRVWMVRTWEAHGSKCTQRKSGTIGFVNGKYHRHMGYYRQRLSRKMTLNGNSGIWYGEDEAITDVSFDGKTIQFTLNQTPRSRVGSEVHWRTIQR